MISPDQELYAVKIVLEMFYGLHYSKKLLSCYAVVSLCLGQTLTEIGDDTLLAVNLLGQHSTNAFVSWIRIKYKLFIYVRV